MRMFHSPIQYNYNVRWIVYTLCQCEQNAKWKETKQNHVYEYQTSEGGKIISK